MGNTDSGRRNLLRDGLTWGAAAAATTVGLTAFTQDEIEESGEKVKLLSQHGEIVEIDKAYLKPVPDAYIDRLEARQGIEGKKFVMVIDLAQCKNLRKCHDACEAMHHLSPEKEWLKVLKMEDSELTSPYWQPTTCFHCDEPPCVKVCPVDATFKRTDGIVLIDNERCIGCRFCMVACPYSARVFDWSEPEIPPEVAGVPYSPETGCPPKKGTVSKCDFCPDMSRKGILPPCVTACPNGVFYFGDENEDAVSNGTITVRLSELLRDRAGYRYLEDLGTKPRLYYLPAVNRAFPFEDDEFTGGQKVD
ncbi:MAG TPA: 4Fe-4S dicluster domain-containing protein [Saprospiraceae bacterium]|nr:4Fe-4S dicluster domain-containing protein [Saprospiraceae bacterium]